MIRVTCRRIESLRAGKFKKCDVGHIIKRGEEARSAERHRAEQQKAGRSVVGVFAALVFGQIAHAFQLRELVQQLLLDPLFQRDVDH